MPDASSTTLPDGHVYDTSRPEILPFVPDGIASLLDVGCGTGGFGALIRERFGPGLRLEGVEPVGAARERAERAGFDRVRDGYFPDVLDAPTPSTASFSTMSWSTCSIPGGRSPARAST